MGLVGPKTREAWERAELSGGARPTASGGVGLPRINRFPESVGPNGAGNTACPLPDEATHYHVQESRPGKRSGAGVPDEEKRAPRQDTMTRQNPAPVPLGEAWEANQPRIDGYSPYARRDDPHAADAEPLEAPEVEAIPVESGFGGGPTGVLFALGTRYGFTTPSGITLVTVATGEGLRFYLPEGVRNSPALTIAVYKLADNSTNPATARRQGVWDLSELLEDHIDLPGPTKDGPRPERQNRSGIGRPPTPAPHETDNPRVCSVRRKPGRFDLQPGIYRIGDRIREGGGLSLVSHLTREFVVTEVEKKTALVFETPNNPRARSLPASPQERERAYRAHVPSLTIERGGTITAYRAYKKASGFSPSEAYPENEEIEIYGYAPDNEPEGLKDGLYQEEFPDPNDPASDTTAIEPPDPTQGPDEPLPIGNSIERGQPSDVLVAASGVTASGAELARSAPVRKRLTAGETYRVKPKSPVGQLRNAEFANLGAGGKPRLWTLLNLPPGRFFAKDGLFTMLQPVTIGGDYPHALGEPVPVTPDTTAAFVGSVSVARRTQGAAELIVQEINDAGVVVRTTAAKSITGGKTTLGPSGFRMGAGTAIPWHADAVAVRQGGRMGPGPDTGANLDMVVSDLDVFLGDSGRVAVPRKFVLQEDGTANFAPPASTPYPRESFFASGPAPIPAGGTTAGGPPPWSVVTFESGAFNPSPAGGWVQQVQGGATAVVKPEAAIHGAYGVEVAAPSSNSPSYNRWRYDAGAGRSSLAIRQLVGASLRPTKGEAVHHRITDGQDRTIGRMMHAGGGVWRVEVLGPSGNVNRRLDVIREDGGDYDLELLVDGGDTKDGAVSVGASRFGEPREILAEVAVDLTGRRPRYAYAQVSSQTNAQGRYRYRIDQIVATPGGDVLDREAPAPPPGEPAPNPDAAPDGAGGFRLYDLSGERTVQDALFLRPGTLPGEFGPRTVRPEPVSPGQDLTVAVRGRHARSGEHATQPGKPYSLILTGPGKDPLDLGSPYAAGCVGEDGFREWWRVYAVPEREGPDDPGYLWADLVSRDMGEGFYLWQDGLFADGALTTEAQRDAARTRALRTNGSVRVTMDTRPPDTVHTPSAQRKTAWAEGSPGVRGTGLANVLWESGPTRDGPWQASADPDLLPENAFVRFSADLVSNGTDPAEIPAGGVYVRTVSEIALLCKENGEDLPGLGVIGELLPDYTRGNYAVKEINGKPFAPKTTDDVRKLPGFAVSVYTEDAARFLQQLTPNDRVRIPDPHVNNGAGLDFLVRCADLLEITDREAPTDLREGVRRVLASFAVPWAYVEEAAPLPKARSHTVTLDTSGGVS